MLFYSAQPDFKDEARVPSPKRVQNYPTQQYPSTNVSYRQPAITSQHPHENAQQHHDDSDDSTATHIIEKSELFNVNGRPRSGVVYSKDSVTVTRPTTCGSEPRTDLKFTVEIEPVDQVTIRTPPKTPEKPIYTKSQTPSPYRSTTPPKSPKHTLVQQPDVTELYERHVSPHFSPAEPPIITRESPKKASPIKVLPPVEHYPDKHYIQAVPPSEQQTISSNASIQDSYESTTDNEQYRKPPVRAVKKLKQASSGETARKKKYEESYASKYAEKSEKPRDLIVSCFVQLQSSNWEEVMEVRAPLFLINNITDVFLQKF